ncbi:MAG: hypothetical protein IJU58_00135 [Clostridia bacterium]|nr:hypothetical protein [Clostridia bacterium]
MAKEEGNVADETTKAAKKAAKKALKAAGPWGWAILAIDGCANFLGCKGAAMCLLLALVGIPGTIIGVLANMGII